MITKNDKQPNALDSGKKHKQIKLENECKH